VTLLFSQVEGLRQRLLSNAFDSYQTLGLSSVQLPQRFVRSDDAEAAVGSGFGRGAHGFSP